jgi:hypothetical protein
LTPADEEEVRASKIPVVRYDNEDFIMIMLAAGARFGKITRKNKQC